MLLESLVALDILTHTGSYLPVLRSTPKTSRKTDD